MKDPLRQDKHSREMSPWCVSVCVFANAWMRRKTPCANHSAQKQTTTESSQSLRNLVGGLILGPVGSYFGPILFFYCYLQILFYFIINNFNSHTKKKLKKKVRILFSALRFVIAQTQRDRPWHVIMLERIRAQRTFVSSFAVYCQQPVRSQKTKNE